VADSGGRGQGGSKARSKRRAGIAEELRRRLEWIAQARATGHTNDAMRAEESALGEALAIVEERTLPEVPPFPNPSPAVLDEWRQLASWSAGRQAAVLCDVLARLAAYDPPQSTKVADTFRAAHHAERVRGKPPRASVTA